MVPYPSRLTPMLLVIRLPTDKGPVVRLAPNRYSILDAEATKTILGHKTSMRKTDFYNSFADPHESNLFTERDNTVHATMRRPVAQLYSLTNLLAYEPAVDTCNSILLRRLRELAVSEKTFDVRCLMQYYAFDVIGEITVGSRFGLMEEKGDHDSIIEEIIASVYYGAYVGLLPGLHPWICRIKTMLGRKTSIATVRDFTKKHLDNRIAGKTKLPEDRSDFLDKLLLLEEEGKATRRHTMTACGQNIIAGSDTTAISLTSLIAHLATNPSALTTLRREIDDATAAKSLSHPATLKEAQSLPYLQGVINEALRLHPAVGFPITRVVGPGGAHLAGRYFPAGTEVGINSWVVHYDTSIFGPDASEFRPDRWIGRTAEERAAMDRNLIAFGSGPRTCIGKNISLMEMYKVLPQIVRNFDFEVVPDAATGAPWTNSTAWFVWQNLQCRIRERA